MTKRNIFFIAVLFAFPAFGQTQLGTDIDGKVRDDQSGSSVSLSADGSIMAIGSPGEGAPGYVSVYQYAAGTWSQLGADIVGDSGDASGKSISLSADGSIVAIGAQNNDGNGIDAGQVRVYQYSAGVWAQLGADIDGESAGDRFGFRLSLSSDGNTLAIGTNTLAIGTDAGHVRVYQYSTGAWTQWGADIDGKVAGDQFGFAISLSSDGSILAIGSPYTIKGSGGWDSRGYVRIYQHTAGAWTQLGDDIDGEAYQDYCGSSVSLSSDGSILAIGATRNSSTRPLSGHVRVYKYATNEWSQLGGDIDGNKSAEALGHSVSLSADGNTLAIGAPYWGLHTGGFITREGHTKVYQYNTGAWIQLGADIEGVGQLDALGYSVSLSADGNIVAFGAPWHNRKGHVRVFSLRNVTSASKPTMCQNLSVYPNPVKSQLTFNINSSFIGATYTICNMVGKEIKTGKLLSENTEVDLDSLPSGSYIVKLLNQNTSHARIIKL